MVRVAVLADCHIDASQWGIGREKAWVNACRQVADRSPDATVIAGDFFDDSTPSEAALELAADGLRMMAEAGVAVMLIPGNHEWFDVSPAEAALRCPALDPLGEIIGVNVFAAPEIAHVHWCDLRIALLPWPRPGETFMDQDAAARRLAAELSGWDGPRLCVAHTVLAEAVGLDGISGHDRGWAPEPSEAATLAAIDRPGVFCHTSLGHVHGRQNLTSTCSYVGSMETFGFHDAGQLRGFSMFEWDQQDQRWHEEHIPTGSHEFVTVAPHDDFGAVSQGAFVNLDIDGHGTTEDAAVGAAIVALRQRQGVRLLCVDDLDVEIWLNCTKQGVRVKDTLLRMYPEHTDQSHARS